MSVKVVTTTSKGQITLPSQWRNQFDTDNFRIDIQESKLVIQPLFLDEFEEGEEVIFDSKRDNNGKGISPAEIIRLIKKIRRERH